MIGIHRVSFRVECSHGPFPLHWLDASLAHLRCVARRDRVGRIAVITGYMMGGLCERKNAQVRETYHGVLMILRHFISKDTFTEHHC